MRGAEGPSCGFRQGAIYVDARLDRLREWAFYRMKGPEREWLTMQQKWHPMRFRNERRVTRKRILYDLFVAKDIYILLCQILGAIHDGILMSGEESRQRNGSCEMEVRLRSQLLNISLI